MSMDKADKTMKTDQEVDAIMQTIPADWRRRWCGGERGACACLGCVQIGNRMVMAKKALGRPYGGDPERIDEAAIPLEVFNEFKVSRQEWEAWCGAHPAPVDAPKLSTGTSDSIDISGL